MYVTTNLGIMDDKFWPAAQLNNHPFLPISSFGHCQLLKHQRVRVGYKNDIKIDVKCKGKYSLVKLPQVIHIEENLLSNYINIK